MTTHVPDVDNVAVLTQMKALFSSVCTEFDLALQAWRRHYDAVSTSLDRSVAAGEDTVHATDRWQPRPELHDEIIGLVNDGMALATRFTALQEPGHQIVEATTALKQQAWHSVSHLSLWRYVIAQLRTTFGPATTHTTEVQNYVGHVDNLAEHHREQQWAGSQEVLGLRSAAWGAERESERGANTFAEVEQDTEKTSEMIDGLEQSGRALADHSGAIARLVPAADAAIDSTSRLARTLVAGQQKSAEQVAATNRTAERLGTRELTTSAATRLRDLDQLRRTLMLIVAPMDEVGTRFRAKRKAIAEAFDAMITRAQQQAAEGAS